MNNKNKSDEAFVNAFRIALDSIEYADNLYLKHLDLQAKCLQDRIELHENNEPLKLFKKSHKKWEDDLNELTTQLHDVYKKVENVIDDKIELYENLKSN